MVARCFTSLSIVGCGGHALMLNFAAHNDEPVLKPSTEYPGIGPMEVVPIYFLAVATTITCSNGMRVI